MQIIVGLFAVVLFVAVAVITVDELRKHFLSRWWPVAITVLLRVTAAGFGKMIHLDDVEIGRGSRRLAEEVFFLVFCVVAVQIVKKWRRWRSK